MRLAFWNSEIESEHLRLVFSDGDFLGRLARFEVNRSDEVPARRQDRWESKRPLGVRHCKKRVRQDSDVSKHPGMHVAFQPHQDFGNGEAPFNRLLITRQGKVKPVV